MSGLDLVTSALATLAVHATVLLGGVWLLERRGGLRHPGWAELAWRGALFGALLTTSVQVARLSQDGPGTGPAAGTPAVVAAAADDTRPAIDRIDPARAFAPDGTRAPAGPSGNVAADTPHASAGAARTAAERLATPSHRDTTPAADARPISTVALPDVLALALLLAWVGAVGVAGARLFAQAAAVRRLARDATRRGTPAPPALAADAAHGAAVLGVAAPSLHLVAGLASPVLLPGRRLLLPAWVPALPVDQRRALLAHELAHLQRADPTWRVLQRLAALPLAWHPLARHALARLEALAEDACDARAARLVGSGRPLAECLAACLAHAGPRRAPVLAVAMAGPPGPVVRRVRNLLEESPMSDRPVSPFLRRTVIAIGLAAAIGIPGLAVTTYAAHAFGENLASRLSLDGDHFRYTSRTDGRSLRMDVKGAVAFDAAESDVVRLGQGARFTLVEKKDGVEREVRIVGRDGRIEREYRVDGDVVPFDAAGRAWLAALLPDVIRETAYDVDGRSRRILAAGGTDALLAEIDRTRGDHARGAYLGRLFALATLDAVQAGRALELARKLESDYELRRALQGAAGVATFPAEKWPLLLEAATAIDSDYELAELLVAIAKDRGLDDTTRAGWLQALGTIGSDYESRRVLESLLAGADVAPATVGVALDAARGIGSDYELRQVLSAAAKHLRGAPGLADAWFAAAGSLESDYEARIALQDAIAAGPVDIAFADRVLAALRGVSSDFEARQVLASLAAAMPDDAALRERYRAQARRLGDFERGQAEQALDRFAAVD